MAITQTITDLPTPPSRSDPANFVSRADTFLASLDDLASEINTWAGQANSTQTSVNNAESSAIAAKNAAEAAQNAATSTAGATVYSDVASYDYPAVAIGSDGHAYRCLGTDVVGDNPVSSVSGNWLRLTVGAAGTWKPITSANSPYQAQSGDRLAIDTTGGPVTITLPLSPVLGDRLEFVDDGQNSETNAITIGRNGKTIQGVAEDMTVNTNGLRFALDYFSGSGNWSITNVSY